MLQAVNHGHHVVVSGDPVPQDLRLVDAEKFLDELSGAVDRLRKDVAEAQGAEAPSGDEPTESWHRPDLNAYAESVGVADPGDLPNKQAVLDAIAEAQAAR
jgi:hypothetical protein